MKNISTSGCTKENLKKLGYSDKTISRFKINPDKVEEGDIPVYLEKRVEKEILGWTVTGQFDMVFNGQLIDFKTTGTYTYETKCKDNDYILQGSIYRWLSPLITEDTIAINFIFKNINGSKKYTFRCIHSHRFNMEFIMISNFS